MIDLTVNDRALSFDGYPEMPLLWYLRNEAGLTGSKFGAVSPCVAPAPFTSTVSRYAPA